MAYCDPLGKESVDICYYLVSDDHDTPSNISGKCYLRPGCDTCVINLPVSFKDVKEIEIWIGQSDTISDTEPKPMAWFLNKLELYDFCHENCVIFPIHRWIWPNTRYCISPNPLLPQNDQNRDERKKEIRRLRRLYQIEYKAGFPIKLQELPYTEKFSVCTQIGQGLRAILADAQNCFSRCTTGPWRSLDDLSNIYHLCFLTQPKAHSYWKEDTWFGYQRLNGCNPKSIRLCEEIPSKLGVDDRMMEPVLRGDTLAGLIQKKRLFYTDLEILEGISHKRDRDFCAPIALFMLNGNDDLVPIAIQLQQKKGQGNPVFLPTDDPNVWTLAKMWYNMADANYHQSVLHLGLTHLLMQIVVVHMRRTIDVSHPVYKLLAPHTFYLMAINTLAFENLIAPDAWVDQTMAVGSNGMYELVCKGLKEWDFFHDGIPAKDFANRKVDDRKVLPKYYFRDDSIALYNSIYKYVSSYIDIYYEGDEVIKEDWEIQEWMDCIAGSSEYGKLQGLPLRKDRGQVTSKKDLKWILAVIIFNCSVSHAAVNFLQYEEYGFPANYPSMLRTLLLRDKEHKTEMDIVNALPDKETVYQVLTLTQLLSKKTTNSLGYFETQYNFDPEANKCVTDFQSDLKKIGEKIKKRNKNLDKPYEVLDPDNIPNAISI